MELLGFDDSKVVLLVGMSRPLGAVYGPEIVAQVADRYSFVSAPTSADLLKKQVDFYGFGLGKFKDVQINELRVYSDGVIVQSKCDTSILDGFVQDLVAWIGTTAGITPAPVPEPIKHFESRVIVRATRDLFAAINPRKEVLATINKVAPHGARYLAASYYADCDASESTVRGKPLHFGIERRNGFPFNQNVFFCVAPLPTEAHIALLSEIEAMAA